MTILTIIFTSVMAHTATTDVQQSTYSFETVAECNAAVNRMRIEAQQQDSRYIQYKVGSLYVSEISYAFGRKDKQRISTTTAKCEG